MKRCMILILAVLLTAASGFGAVAVSNVSARQIPGTKTVEINYDVAADTATVTVSLEVKNGAAAVASPSVSGHVGAGVATGTGRAIVWNAGADWNGNVATLAYTVIADDGVAPPVPSPDITWVSINDPGVSGYEGFIGDMSKYETTNAQYCQYLNAALASGDIVVSGTYVNGASGSNSGEDFAGQNYYRLDGPGYTSNGATNGGAARINWTGSSFTVDSGFENHPVTYVSWYGATAFAAYYGWRLPTEWEWQAVADYDGSYAYGCGTSINNSIANYLNSTHPHGTTPVGQYGTFGYGVADMAGNVWEWTNSIYSGSYRVLRGGSWVSSGYNCAVSGRGSNNPYDMSYFNGFRVCR